MESTETEIQIKLYPNGQKMFEGHYKDGERQGLWTWWHENGGKMFEGNFQDGKQHGPWTWWDRDGEKISEALYEAGEIVNVTAF